MPLQNIFVSYNMDHFEDDEDRSPEGKKSKVWKQTVGGDSGAPVLVLSRTQV